MRQKKRKVYGLSRTRDAKGKVVKRDFKDYVMCLHAQIGGGRENMWVLVAETYEEDDNDDSLPSRGV